jgi:hypothetical protein
MSDRSCAGDWSAFQILRKPGGAASSPFTYRPHLRRRMIRWPSASTSNRSGTVTDYTPGAAIVLDPGTGQPVHFIIGKTVEIVTPDGKVIKAADVKKNAKVHVHLLADGDRTVVDQITVDDAK